MYKKLLLLSTLIVPSLKGMLPPNPLANSAMLEFSDDSPKVVGFPNEKFKIKSLREMCSEKICPTLAEHIISYEDFHCFLPTAEIAAESLINKGNVLKKLEEYKENGIYPSIGLSFQSKIVGCQFFNNGMNIFVALEDGSAFVYDLFGILIKQFTLKIANYLQHVSINNDGTLLLVTPSKKYQERPFDKLDKTIIYLYDANKHSCICMYKHVKKNTVIEVKKAKFLYDDKFVRTWFTYELYRDTGATNEYYFDTYHREYNTLWNINGHSADDLPKGLIRKSKPSIEVIGFYIPSLSNEQRLRRIKSREDCKYKIGVYQTFIKIYNISLITQNILNVIKWAPEDIFFLNKANENIEFIEQPVIKRSRCNIS